MNRPPPIPLRPDYSSMPRAATYLERAVCAHALSTAAGDGFGAMSAERVARRMWPDDGGVTGLVLRGTSAPADRTTSGWASTVAHNVVGDFIGSLAPLSAGANLLNAAPRVSLEGVNQINFPRRLNPLNATDVAWIGELGPMPIPVMQIGSGSTLGPSRKLCAAVVFTREVAESSAAEVVMRTLLRESCAFSLDAALFSNAAATAVRPAGILNGISALPAAPNGDDAALGTDLTKLAAAIGVATTGLAIVAHPAQANAIKLRRGGTFPSAIPVWPTLGVAAGTVIALDPAAFASAFGPEPEISSSTETLVHLEDTTPAQIGTPGSPSTVAAPTRSLFQTDAIAVRLILRCAWTWRVSGAVAWISGTTW
jgi:hypothetical protein